MVGIQRATLAALGTGKKDSLILTMTGWTGGNETGVVVATTLGSGLSFWRERRPCVAMNRRWGALLLLVLVVNFWVLWRMASRESRYDREIRAAARRYSVPPALVKAVVWRESRFDAKAKGRAGEIGLMQLMDFTAQEWADDSGVKRFRPESAFDPAINTMAGTYYLSKVSKRYRKTDQPWAYALADYNAGRANVLKWMRGRGATNSGVFVEQIEFPTTRDYVRSTLERYAYYQKQFE